MQMTPRDKKLLQIMGIVLPLLLIVYFLFLRPGGGEEVALPEFPSGPTGIGLPTGATGSPSETPRETLPPVELAGARDPFSIPPGLELDTGGSVGPTGATGSGGTTTTSPPPTTTSPPPTTTSPPPTTTSPPPTTTSPPPTTPPPPPDDEEPGNKILIGGHEVKLQSITVSKDKVEVNVDGRLWTVEEGATFDDNFKLVKILDGDCAKFLYGDQSFELCQLKK